ncbi:MAG: hypothetical protein ACRD8O_06180 [Bryobacteraceae bacterium]
MAKFFSSGPALPAAGAVFEKFGLRTRGSWRAPGVADAYSQLPPASCFRTALEELGGLYAAFAGFLAWRADLLRTDYLGRLRYVRVTEPPVSQGEVARVIVSQLGSAGEPIARTVEAEPCWNTVSRCAYRAQYEGRAIAVQVTRDPVPDRAFEEFHRNVSLLTDENLTKASAPATLEQFRQWMRLTDSPVRERAYLEAFATMRGRTIAEYPVLIPEISTGNLLCFEWIEGEPVAPLIARGSVDAVRKLAECTLEQICTLAALDAELDPDAMVIAKSGKLALRRANRMVAIPPARAGMALKYISAVLAGNAPIAANQLVRLLAGRTGLELESSLLDELSNLELELKIHLQFPASAAVFEGNWRALAQTGVERPLFLDIMHRNLVAVGYWNAEAAASPQPGGDFIADAQWPVLSQLLRARLVEMFDRQVAQEWMIGSGLLLFEGMRQMGRLAEQARDDDVAIGVDLPERNGSTKTIHRNIRNGIVGGMMLILFLVSLRLAATSAAPWSAVGSMLAVVAAAALFWFVARME